MNEGTLHYIITY